MPEELKPINCHPSVRYIFDYWLSINRRRPAFDSGVTYTEIYSWSWLKGIRLNTFELDCLEKIEELYFRHIVKPKLDEIKRAMERR